MPSIFIDNDGEMTGIASELTTALGLHSLRRVSHVEPVNPVLRWLFYAIRKRCNDASVFASFTRVWPCRWQAQIFDGPMLGPFDTRKAAIAAEVQFIEERIRNVEHSSGYGPR